MQYFNSIEYKDSGEIIESLATIYPRAMMMDNIIIRRGFVGVEGFLFKAFISY